METKEKNNNLYRNIANTWIDQLCEINGVDEAIRALLEIEVTPEELVSELGFDREDVQRVVNE